MNMQLKKDRHSYYEELSKNKELTQNKVWLKEALNCTLEKHASWTVSESSLEKILTSNIYTTEDYLDFISIKNKLIAQDLRVLEFNPSINITKQMYSKHDLPHMQKNGFIKSTNDFTVAHYEAESFRLIKIAQEIKRYIKEHFILYEYKGNIATDNLEVIKILNKKYPDGINVDGSKLIVDDNKLDIHSLYYEIAIPSSIDIRSAHPSFGVEAIANTLSNIIINIPEKSGMMIGIFGKWGRGKTYLIDKIWNNINNKNENFIRIDFSAWKYQDTKESWAYLYEVMMNKYLKEDINKNLSENWFYKIKKLFKLNITRNGYSALIAFFISLFFSIYLSFFGGLKTLVGLLGLVVSIKLFLL